MDEKTKQLVDKIMEDYEGVFRCFAHGPTLTCPICCADGEEPDIWWPGPWDDER